MKKRKQNRLLFLWIGLGVLVFFLVLAAVCLRLILEVPSRQQAEQAIQSTFSEILGVSPDRGNLVAKAIAENLSVSAEKVERGSFDQDIYRVTCTVANRDIQAVYAQVDASQQMTMDQFMAWFVQRLSEQQMLEYQETFVLYKGGDGYRVQMTEEQFDHCSGGLIQWVRKETKGET